MLTRSRLAIILVPAWIVILAACNSNSPTGGTANSTTGDALAVTTDDEPESPDDADAATDDADAGENGAVTRSPSRTVRTDVTLGGLPPAKSDTLLRYYGDDPDTLNFVTSNDTVSRAFQRHVYEAMADRRIDDPLQWTPILAESWEFDQEKLEYTIHLRKGVQWHPASLPNGRELPRRELTARDVKFTFDCILNEYVEAASLRSYYMDPEAKDPAKKQKIKLTVIDDYTVKVKWTKPYFMADEFTLGIAVIPRHVYSVDENGEPISFDFRSKEFADGFNNHWANTTMCGTGPLIFKEWIKGQRVTLVRNPDYWAEPFYFDKVVFRFISNPNTAQQQVLQNDLDWAGIPQKDHYMQSKKHPNVIAGKVLLKEFDQTGYRYMSYNLRRDVFKDKRVRWAMSHATPVDSIMEKIYFGLAVRRTGPFVTGGAFADNDLPPVSFDLDKSRQLLEEAGWRDTDNDGVRDKEVGGQKIPFRFDLMIYADSPQYLTIAETIKETFRSIGIDVQISPAKWALMLQKLRKKEFDATILGWATDWKGDPFQIWHGSQADLPESSNSIGYQNPEVDKLIEQLRITLDEEKQITLYHEIHRLIYEDQPYTFLFTEKATAGLHARIENVSFYPTMRPFYDVREWHTSSPRMLGK